jgi:DNA-binding winged helix-turn-helix (wHTH) protein/TolB-like protein/Tfp pilus assembly protein PilF
LYEFASFRLDPAERRLLRDGEPVALTPKCFDLLVVLVESGGHLLEKSDLMARVWPDQFVEEGSLSFNVSELRKALGEGQNGQQYIETVRKKGFRFVAPVAEIPVGENAVASGEVATSRGELPSAIETTPHSSRRFAIVLALVAAAALTSLAYVLWPRPAVTPLEGPPRTIAVLPFKPLAADVRDEPLEMGICDALITRLAGLDQLVVRPTSAVVSYNRLGQDPLAAGRELGVDALLEGYIQRSQGRVRVTARLLRTADGKSLWSGQFNEKFTDIFTVEDSISRQIAEALQLNISGDEQKRVTKHSTENVEAYELYLKGDYFQEKRTPDGVARSIEYFQQATAKDPRYALAFAALANSYVVLAIRADMPPKDSYQKAKAAALRALEIDPANAQAHSALANVKSWYDWDWPAAEREFQRAIALSPNDSTTRQQYASFLIVMGRHAEAIEQILRAERFAPVSMHISVQVARILFFAQQTDAAMEQCRKSLEMDDTFGGAHLFLGRIYTQKHMYREAHTELERGRALLPNSAEVLSLIGYTYAVSGRAGEAQQVLEELQRLSRLKYVSPYHIAMVYAGLGKKDDAFQWLEKAYDEREGRMTLLRFAPEFAPLRSDPRFTQLL